MSAATLVVAISACSSSDEQAPGGEQTSDFKSFEVGAEDTSFYSPIDAAVLDDGSLVFLAVAANSSLAEPGEEEGPRSTASGNRMALFHQLPGQKPVVITDAFELPRMLASDGADLVYVADAKGLVRVSIASRIASVVDIKVEPRGVTVAKDGTVYITGVNAETRVSGVYRLDGSPVAEGGLLSNLSGIDVDDAGRIYAVSSTGASDVPEELIAGGGRGALYLIEGGNVTVLSAGFEAAEPLGIALRGNTLAVSSYEGRGDSSAVLLYDVGARKLDPAVYTNDKLRELNVSGGLHRNTRTNRLAWSAPGGNRVFLIE